MTPDDYRRVRSVFDSAMERPAQERRAFVESNTPTDDPFRRELLAMVETGDDSSFLASAFLAGALTSVPAEPDGPPDHICNYKILRVLGRGGMGTVYLALRDDDVFHKVVALKVIGGSGLTSLDFIERFKQERQILAGLDHPNIARMLDGGSTEDGRPFYVMEYVAGSPIDDYCARMKADVAVRVRMIIQVCEAVEYLHAHAIVHRDIKPNNILVTPEGRAKLVDFGVAKVDTVEGMVASPSAPGQATMIMTPGYASPEQIVGDPSGKSSDIYSLAVVLYRLLTGRLPYLDDKGRPDLAAQLAGQDPAPPSKDPATSATPATRNMDSRRTSRPDLDRVVVRALQRDPLQRYATIQAFAEDLRRCLDGRPIVAHSDSWIYRFGKLVSRNRVAATLAVLLGIFGCAGAWTAISVHIERAQLEAKESEIERFVALLNVKVARWTEPEAAVPVAEKMADVRAANSLMGSATMRTLAARTPDPPRLKRVVAEVRRFLDRADTHSGELPLVRKEIAMVYREVGDFEANPAQAQLSDRQQAAASYKRAATIAASVGTVDPAWVRAQLAELGARLQVLGMPLELAAAEARPADPVVLPPVALPPSAVPTKREGAAHERVGSTPVDEAAYTELRDRLRTTTASARRARANLESLRDRLVAQGQAIRPDLLSSITTVDALLEEAAASLASNDLAAAEDVLRRASYELRRLTQSVGS